MSNYFSIFDTAQLSSLVKTRLGETKLGERVLVPHQNDWKEYLQTCTAQFILIGIPEDIGVRANHGTGGTHTAWPAALSALLNIQSTSFFTGSELCILGSFHFEEWLLQSEGMEISDLRQLVAQIDEAVEPVIAAIVAAGKTPIVIGGGHNNAYPIIKACATVLGQPINCINLDAHSDYRALEGRHSGNGFHYAQEQKYLGHYSMIGLQQNYNSALIIESLERNPQTSFSYFEDICILHRLSFEQAMTDAISACSGLACGIELDLDCIQNVLSSAQSPSGFSANQARQYLSTMAQQTQACYLHLPEGATALANGQTNQSTGKLIAFLISDFIKMSLQAKNK